MDLKETFKASGQAMNEMAGNVGSESNVKRLVIFKEDKMKDTTMQDLGMENEIHLCDSCHEELPECNPDFVIYGTGKGNDNIAACNIYNPVHTRNYEEERDNVLRKI